MCHARRKIGVLRPLFPRYLFVAVGPGRSLYEVNTTPGVATVLHVGGVPLEIAVEIIDLLRKRADEHGRTDAPRVRELVRPRFAPGAATGWHRHEYDYVVVPLLNGKLELSTGDGEPQIAELSAGVPYFRQVGVEHDVINVNDFEYAFIEVEFK